MGAARKLTPLKTMSRALVKAVARLEPDTAVARLAAHYAAEPQGLRRRALLAARIEMIRKAMEAPPKPVVDVVPEPEPVVEPPPPVVIVPPKPMSKGVVTSINLDDVAKMLMAAPAAEEVAEPPVPEAPAGAAAMPDVAAAFAALDWGDTAEQVDVPSGGEAPLWADPAVAGSTTTAGAAPDLGKGSPGMMDLAAQFAAMGAEDQAPIAPKGFDLSATFAAMDAGDAVEETSPALPAGMDDAFAMLGTLDEVEVVAEKGDEPAKASAALDLAAQFAAMGDGAGDDSAVAVVADAGVALAMLDALDEVEVVAEHGDEPVEASAALDLAAQFAAMEDEAGDDAAPVMSTGMDDAFAMLSALGEAEGPAEASGALELAAEFAALEDGLGVDAPPALAAGTDGAFAMPTTLEEAKGALEGADAPVGAEGALDLGAQFAAMGDGTDVAEPIASQEDLALAATPMPEDESGEPLTALQLAMRRLEARRAAMEDGS